MAQRPIAKGERAPDFALPRGAATVRYYSTVGGTPAVLLLAGDRDADTTRSLLGALRDGVPGAATVDVVALDGACAEELDGYHDVEGRVHDAYGVSVDGAPIVIALDPSVRVAVVEQATDLARAVGRIAFAVARLVHEPSERTIVRQAPVLFVPNALSEELRSEVIAAWSAGATATGVEATVGHGRGEVHDEQRKRRRDHTVADDELLRTLTTHIGRRVMPELSRAFAYRATRFEGFKIGCYEETERGFFEPHRDNLSAATAHRRFALSLNLNDDYDGGELRFPEYGPDRYRPAAGEALLFSGALLHEVRPVIRGRRFVLLSFLYGDEVRRRDTG
ncbi:MAG: 2OG-Fe(II) oxygenase [Actinobacteria bacterium]|nr:2OG-Fe(II) oxygenase [Actinomycetota bacterium]